MAATTNMRAGSCSGWRTATSGPRPSAITTRITQGSFPTPAPRPSPPDGSTHMDRKTYPTSETVDFIVVGSGSAGGIVARELALAGNSVVIMEQGPRLDAHEFEHDELKYRQLSGITNNPATNPQTFRRDESQKAETPSGRNPLTYARVVGG